MGILSLRIKYSSNKYLLLTNVPILSGFVILAVSRSKIKIHSKSFLTYPSCIKIKYVTFFPCYVFHVLKCKASCGLLCKRNMT